MFTMDTSTDHQRQTEMIMDDAPLPSASSNDSPDHKKKKNNGGEPLDLSPRSRQIVIKKKTALEKKKEKMDRSDSFVRIFCDEGSDWEDGLAALESILKPNSKVRQAMTRSQIRGLQNVRNILLGNDGNDELSRTHHIPREVLKCSSSDFLLAQFAGIQRRSSAKQVMKNVVTANRFIMGLKLKAISQSSLRKNLCRPLREWTELPLEAKEKVAKLLSWDVLSDWSKFDVFELAKLTGNKPLLFVGWAVLCSPYAQHVMEEELKLPSPTSSHDEAEGHKEKQQPTHFDDWPGYHFLQEYHIPHESMFEFLREMEASYQHTNPYHNNIHAADVVQGLHSMLWSMGGKDYAESDLHLFSILLAAVIHDVGHPGLNNSFQVNAHSDLALNYNDFSVLENMHASRAFQLLLGKDRDPRLNIFMGMSADQIAKVRQMVIDAVIHTDMTKHFSSVNSIKGILLNQKSDLTQIKTNSKDAAVVLNFTLHLADISNPAREQPLAIQWTDRCLEEFFIQGDHEKELKLPVSPLCDRETTTRPDSQIGFIEFVVLPAFQTLGICLPAMAEKVVPVIVSNLAYWKKLKEDESKMEIIVETASDEE